MRPSAYHQGVVRPALPVDTYTNGATNGTTVDKHYNQLAFRSVVFAVHTGTITDGAAAVTVQESANGTDWTAAPASAVEGTPPAVTDSDSDKVFEVGYVGSKRYVRIVSTVTGSTTGGVLGAVAYLTGAANTPVVH